MKSQEEIERQICYLEKWMEEKDLTEVQKFAGIAAINILEWVLKDNEKN